jgi:hypothetical protein
MPCWVAASSHDTSTQPMLSEELRKHHRCSCVEWPLARQTENRLLGLPGERMVRSIRLPRRSLDGDFAFVPRRPGGSTGTAYRSWPRDVPTITTGMSPWQRCARRDSCATICACTRARRSWNCQPLPKKASSARCGSTTATSSTGGTQIPSPTSVGFTVCTTVQGHGGRPSEPSGTKARFPSEDRCQRLRGYRTQAMRVRDPLGLRP